MKKLLIILGLLIWVGTIYGQSGVIRRTQTALVDTLATHIIKANWDTYIGSGGFSDPMTTRGDIIYRNSSNVTDRLAVGSNTYVLTSDGTDVSWAAPSVTTPTRQVLTSGTSITFDGDNGTWASLTLAHNATLTFNDFSDFTEGVLRVIQDATGSRTLAFAETITAVTSIEYSGGLSLINPDATTTTVIRYTLDDTVLRLDVIYYE